MRTGRHSWGNKGSKTFCSLSAYIGPIASCSKVRQCVAHLVLSLLLFLERDIYTRVLSARPSGCRSKSLRSSCRSRSGKCSTRGASTVWMQSRSSALGLKPIPGRKNFSTVLSALSVPVAPVPNATLHQSLHAFPLSLWRLAIFIH